MMTVSAFDRRRRGVTNCTSAVAMSLIAAVLFASSVGGFAAESSASATPLGMAITVTKSEKTCFSRTLVVVGTLAARNEVLVRPDREGLQITQILGQAGDRVSSGQILARLAPTGGQPGSAVAVRAPVDGILVAAPTVVGTMATARGEPLFRIVGQEELELVADVPASQITRLFAGQSASVRIAGLDDLPGRIRLVSIAVDPALQLGQVRVSVSPTPDLRAGAFGRAVIDTGRSCGLAIPLSALLYGPDGPVVQVVRDGRVESRPVSIGLFSAGQAEAREGLNEGDMIVVRAGAFLREGDRVRPVTERRR